MAESIFARMSRILSARIEDSVDHLEKAGGESVMREAVREADRAIDQVKAEREVVMSRRLQAARHQILLAKRVEALNGKASFAIDEGRDDLAEAALSRQIDFEAEAEKLSEAEAQAREQEARLEEGLAALKARKTHMEDALKAYLISQREAAMGGDGPARADRAAEKKVDAAEQAFDRAMTGVGGLSMARVDTETVHRVAEIDALQRNAAIARRLAALKAQRAA